MELQAADEAVKALEQQIAELELKSSTAASLAVRVKNFKKESKVTSRAWMQIATTTTASKILTDTTWPR